MNKESETTDFKYFEEWYYSIALQIIRRGSKNLRRNDCIIIKEGALYLKLSK